MAEEKQPNPNNIFSCILYNINMFFSYMNEINYLDHQNPMAIIIYIYIFIFVEE